MRSSRKFFVVSLALLSLQANPAFAWKLSDFFVTTDSQEEPPATVGPGGESLPITVPWSTGEEAPAKMAPAKEEPAKTEPVKTESIKPEAKKQEETKPCVSGNCLPLPKLPAPDFKAIPQGKARVEAFKNYYGPLAVALQKATGYPASLMISQWAEESGWGSSTNYRVMNNIAGHRCWKAGEKRVIKVQIPGMEKEIVTSCERNGKGGILYLKFPNPIDSTLSYIQNLMYAENTAKAYQSIRAEVAKAKPGLVEWRKMMPGLRSYCPWDQYQVNIPNILRNNKLEEWEKKEVCSCF